MSANNLFTMFGTCFILGAIISGKQIPIYIGCALFCFLIGFIIKTIKKKKNS